MISNLTITISSILAEYPRKRKRTMFTDHQLEELKSTFHKNHYPSSAEIDDLSKRLGLERGTVQVCLLICLSVICEVCLAICLNALPVN